MTNNDMGNPKYCRFDNAELELMLARLGGTDLATEIAQELYERKNIKVITLEEMKKSLGL